MRDSETSPRTAFPLRILLWVAVTLFLGLLLKLPCASGDWSDGRAYTRYCYSDIVPLYRIEHLAEGKLPYFQAPNEYPVGIGMLMGVTGLPVKSDADFFLLNVAILSAAAIVITLLLYRMVGTRALYFALAPTLLLYGFLNWDLVPVALATAATYAYLRDRHVTSGALLGAGAAAKVFPGYLVVPFALGLREKRRMREAARLVAAAVFVWLVANAPVALGAFHNWTLFFRFNGSRQVDWGTMWFAGCHHLVGSLDCGHPGLYATLSLIAFVVASLLVWRWKVAGDPGFARWTFGFPLLVVFLLTAKVYSPQYSLWLLAWFALVLPDLRLFLAFEAADVAVFFTEFSWLGRHTGFGGLPVGFLEVAVVARGAVLIACLVTWVRTEGSREEAHSEVASEPAGR